MYGSVPEPWWLRSAAPIGTLSTQIYVYMQVVRGRLGEIYVYIALQASPELALWDEELQFLGVPQDMKFLASNSLHNLRGQK